MAADALLVAAAIVVLVAVIWRARRRRRAAELDGAGRIERRLPNSGCETASGTLVSGSALTPALAGTYAAHSAGLGGGTPSEGAGSDADGGDGGDGGGGGD